MTAAGEQEDRVLGLFDVNHQSAGGASSSAGNTCPTAQLQVSSIPRVVHMDWKREVLLSVRCVCMCMCVRVRTGCDHRSWL